jgi:hypothetical protein
MQDAQKLKNSDLSDRKALWAFIRQWNEVGSFFQHVQVYDDEYIEDD